MTDSLTTIDDFALRLVDAGEGGKHIDMVSASRGRLAGFPFWDHADRDLRHFSESDIPIGTADAPYDERDGSWGIYIMERDGWVYVAEMDGHDGTTFRVRTDLYLAAWRALINRFNPAVPLDALFDDSEVQ